MGNTDDDVLDQISELAEKVKVIDGFIVIIMGDEDKMLDNEYSISLFKCKTYNEVLKWTYHLSEKSWMNRKLLRQFMVTACNANKLDISL